MLGFGYRPVLNDRLTALAKYTYFYNVPTTDQVTQQNIAAQFLQKSHIASLDLTYDLSQRWSVGGKYAYRLGAVSLERDDPQFLDNTAQLLILRTDLRFGQYWEGMVEGRMLDLPDLDEQRGGALLGIYRYLGEHVKVWSRLQLHRILGRPDGPELRPPGRVHQRGRVDVTWSRNDSA